MVQRRDLVVAIILSVITCGIYGIYWMICLNDDVNKIAQDADAMSGGVVFLLSLVTCGIYSWVWMYQMGTKLDDAEISYGRSSQSRGILYLVLSLFGFGIVSYALMQDTVNKYAN